MYIDIYITGIFVLSKPIDSLKNTTTNIYCSLTLKFLKIVTPIATKRRLMDNKAFYLVHDINFNKRTHGCCKTPKPKCIFHRILNLAALKALPSKG